ncbi:MAG: hypothetical protein AB8B78_06600 [Polaribacter sp.]
MKKITLLITLLISISCFCQSDTELTFKDHTNTNPDNELSKYFKKVIQKKLLKKISYSNNFKSVKMSFLINKENEPYHIKLNTFSSSELDKEVIKAFKKYPLEKLNLDTINRKSIYYLQIISGRKRKNIFDCSEKINRKTLPNCNFCNDLEYYDDIKTCIQRKIRDHFFENIDFSIVKRFEKSDNYSIGLKMMVNNNGELQLIEIKSSKIFHQPIKNAFKIFPEFTIPSTLNNNKTTWKYNASFKFNKNNLPPFKKNKINYDSIYSRNTTNDFAVFLKEKINNDDLVKANLSRLKNKVSLSFELNKKNKPFNIKTTSRSSSLNNIIISAFKEYPISNLKFYNKSSFNSYFTQVLALENNKTIIKTNSIIGSETVPVYPGCENSKNVAAAKKCFSKGVQMHFAKKFDTSLPNRLGLTSGRKRIYISFKISKEGNIIDITAKAPHIKIKEEVIRVMKRLPKAKPGMQSNKKVNVKYSIPFTLIVE